MLTLPSELPSNNGGGLTCCNRPSKEQYSEDILSSCHVDEVDALYAARLHHPADAVLQTTLLGAVMPLD
jgi:hypothetical protein